MDIITHLNELSGDEAMALRAVVNRLRAMSERSPAPDLTSRILKAVKAERSHKKTRAFHFAPWYSAAAVAVIMLAGWLWLRIAPADGDSGDPSPATLAWLAAAQEPDGTWSPARHGGAEAYRPALTALSALALASAPGNQYRTNVQRACDALVRAQSDDGAFGGKGRALYYNQAITTYALASLYTHTPCPRPVIERALAFMCARQSLEGGWDYEEGTGGNAAVTAWHVRALACMAQQDFSAADIPLRKALRWLRGTARDDGSIAYHHSSITRSESLNALAAHALITGGAAYPQLVALGKRISATLTGGDTATDSGADCYRDYAKILALEAAGSAQAADKIRARMFDRDTDSQDQWEMVGGSLYTTALTALAAH